MSLPTSGDCIYCFVAAEIYNKQIFIIYSKEICHIRQPIWWLLIVICVSDFRRISSLRKSPLIKSVVCLLLCTMHLHHFAAAVLLLGGAFDVILGLGIIVPGTKWCGPGNIALNYDDLGSERELDMCCRSHDNCQEKILPHQEAYGLSNDGVFPIFSCACESAFRNCLTSLRNGHSLTLGRIYFLTKEVCFAHGHPTVSCQENQVDMFEKRCLNYKVDEAQPKRWQFYDLAFYTHVEEDAVQSTED